MMVSFVADKAFGYELCLILVYFKFCFFENNFFDFNQTKYNVTYDAYFTKLLKITKIF